MKDCSFNDKTLIRAVFRQPRTTWILLLASAVPLYAIPLLFQAIYEARRWPSYYEVSQISPGSTLRGSWWLREVAPCCAFLVIAALVPRLLHLRWLSRLNLPVVEDTVGPIGSYRRPAERQFLVHARGVRAIVAAYYARLAAVVLLLMPALVLACGIASPIQGWGSVMPPSITFSSPEEYLPVFIAATMIVLLNAPTEVRLLGPHGPAFRAGIAGDDRREAERRDLRYAAQQAAAADAAMRRG